jgi:hypothetical protein
MSDIYEEWRELIGSLTRLSPAAIEELVSEARRVKATEEEVSGVLQSVIDDERKEFEANCARREGEWKALLNQVQTEISELPEVVRDVVPDGFTVSRGVDSVEGLERKYVERAPGPARMAFDDVKLLLAAHTRLIASRHLLIKLGRRAPDPALMFVLDMLNDADDSLGAIIHRELPADAIPEYLM